MQITFKKLLRITLLFFTLMNCYMEASSQTIEDYQKMAEQGDTKSQFHLGVNGDGVIMNKVEAVKWFRKAAEQGIAEAQCNLGNCYNIGEGVGMNKAEAAKWFRMAAKQGCVEAQYILNAIAK